MSGCHQFRHVAFLIIEVQIFFAFLCFNAICIFTLEQSNHFFLASRSMFAFGDGTFAVRMSSEHSPRGGVFGIGHATMSQSQSECCPESG